MPLKKLKNQNTTVFKTVNFKEVTGQEPIT